jgi:hypothetical protein
VQSAVQTAQQSAQTHSQQIVSEAAGSTQHGQNSSSRYGVMLDDAEVDTLEPGTPGTASP